MPLSPPVRFAPRRRSKSAYFGDLHVHTRYSSDAYLLGTCARLFGTCARRTTPTVFANGRSHPARRHRTDLPQTIQERLDFAGVGGTSGSADLC